MLVFVYVSAYKIHNSLCFIFSFKISIYSQTSFNICHILNRRPSKLNKLWVSLTWTWLYRLDKSLKSVSFNSFAHPVPWGRRHPRRPGQCRLSCHDLHRHRKGTQPQGKRRKCWVCTAQLREQDDTGPHLLRSWACKESTVRGHAAQKMPSGRLSISSEDISAFLCSSATGH